VLNQEGAADVAMRISQASPVLASRLVRGESDRALLQIVRVRPDLSSRIRSLDAIHLATFERLRRLEPASEFLSYDERLRAAL
jgi:hypothetical protein